MTLAQQLRALGLAQATMVAPALDGSYASGTANTIAMLLLLLAQDAATAAGREAREVAAMAALVGEGGDYATLLARVGELHAGLGDDAASAGLEQRILAFYVEMADAARLTLPAA